MKASAVHTDRVGKPADDYTDSDILTRLEYLISSGVVIWDGKGEFPHNREHYLGLSLLGGRRSLRDAVKQCLLYERVEKKA